MNQNIKQRWLEALRSGKYKRGTGTLKAKQLGEKGYRYCCLGVLCDLYSKEKLKGRAIKITSLRGLLPLQVIKWAEIDLEKEESIYRYDSAIPNNLSTLNDSSRNNKDDLSYACVIPAIEKL
jgi:hypothetical protein